MENTNPTDSGLPSDVPNARPEPLSAQGMSAMQGSDMPVASPPVSEASDLHSPEQEAISSLQQQETIQPETWAQLDDDQRIQALQNTEDTMAGLQGRPSAEVTSYQADPGQFGYYDPNSNEIKIGSYSLQNEDAKENVDTVVHEGRHAYQQYAIEHPGFHPNQEEVNAWRENLKPGNYLSAQEYGQELYQSQPVEADAWRYGNDIANGVYGGNHE